MTYGSALYLAYGQIAVGIELLGACGDTHDFAQQGHSKCRCERGISDYMAQSCVHRIEDRKKKRLKTIKK